MATMIPNVISRDTLSEGEKQIFNKLQNETIAENWIVLHSLDIAKHGWQFKGEADFVILIPNHGVMVVEVKACNYIKRDSNGWFYGRNSLPKKRGPFKQAYEARQSILEYVREIDKKFISIPFFHCVVFTHLNFTINSTEWNEWDWHDNTAIEQYGISHLIIESMKKNIALLQQNPLNKYQFLKPDEFKGNSISDLSQILRPAFEFYEHPNVKKRRWHKNIIYYTDQQFKALDIIFDQVFFSGPAGTGKTLLACETARRGSLRGYKTLFLCYNNNILYWLKSNLSGLKIKVESIGKFLLELSELDLKRVNTDKEFWDTTLPSIAERKIQNTKIDRYDLIVIDEAQDIVYNKRYMKVLDMLLKDGISKGKIRMFGDPQYQQIYSKSNGVLNESMNLEETFGSKVPIITLSENCRNTFPIGKYTEFLGSAVGCYTEYLRKGDYDKPMIKYYNNYKEQLNTLNQTINAILEEGFECSDVIVLSPFTNSIADRSKGIFNTSYSFHQLDKRGLKNLIRKDNKSNKIYFTTIHSFKGLESCIVILTDIDELNQINVLYTGMSRAQNKLIILAKETIKTSINKKLEEMI